MASNGGAHKFNKNENNWLHKHFEPQQVDVVVSSTSILALDSLTAFARSHPLTIINLFKILYKSIIIGISVTLPAALPALPVTCGRIISSVLLPPPPHYHHPHLFSKTRVGFFNKCYSVLDYTVVHKTVLAFGMAWRHVFLMLMPKMKLKKSCRFFIIHLDEEAGLDI